MKGLEDFSDLDDLLEKFLVLAYDIDISRFEDLISREIVLLAVYNRANLESPFEVVIES